MNGAKRLTRLTRDADTIRSADQLHGVFIHPYEPDGVNARENAAVEATGTYLKTQSPNRNHIISLHEQNQGILGTLRITLRLPSW